MFKVLMVGKDNDIWSGNLISGNEDIINNLLKKLEI